MVTETIEFYKEGFFGYGNDGEFQYWSLAHFVPIVVLAVVVCLIYRFRKNLIKFRHEEEVRFLLGGLCLFFWMSYYWRLLYVGNEGNGQNTFLTKLPLELCEWNCVLSSFMIMKKSRRMFGMSFLITFTFGIIPLITPATISNAGPCYFRYYQFWLMHILPPVINFYMLFVHGFELRKRDILNAECFCLILLFFAITANLLIPGANYCYIAANTEQSTIANGLPDSMAVKSVIAIFGALILFSSIYAVYYFIKRKYESKRESIK